MSRSRVGLVLVSHSAAAAEGTAQIASQMAPDVTVLAAGGTEEGIGTSFDRVHQALEQALEVSDDGVVVLTDLGSAVLTTEAVLELLEPEAAELVRVPDAPFVEGAVAAAVEAQQGGDLGAVKAAAVRAGSLFGAHPSARRQGDEPSGSDGDGVAGGPVEGEELSMEVVVRNPLGLHARPAALLARAIADSGAPVTVDGVDGASVLELMRLGATGGRRLTLVASGPRAREALDAAAHLVETGFGET